MDKEEELVELLPRDPSFTPPSKSDPNAFLTSLKRRPARVLSLLILISTLLFLSHHHQSRLTFLYPPSQSCPSPFNPPISPNAITFDICHDLPTSIPSLSSRLCQSTSHCSAFSLQIQRTNITGCSIYEEIEGPKIIVNDTELDRYVRGSLGPDEFLVRVEGSQRWTLQKPTKYEGGCKYHFDFFLANSGDVFIDTWLMSTNYSSIRETPLEINPLPVRPNFSTRITWTESLVASLFPSPLQLSLCPLCPTLSLPSRIGSPKTYRIPSPSSSTPLSEEVQALPICSPTSDDYEGVYLPINSYDQRQPSQNPFATLPPSDSPSRFKYTFPQSPSESNLNSNATSPISATYGQYGFVPTTCRWNHTCQRFDDSEGGSCLDERKCRGRKERFMMFGDSSGEVFYDGLLMRLGGKDQLWGHEPMLKATLDMIAEAGLDWGFTWDPFAEQALAATCEELSVRHPHLKDLAIQRSRSSSNQKWDIIALATGRHYVKFGKTLLQSLTHYEAVIDHLTSCRPSTSSQRLLFLTTGSQAPRRDDQFLWDKDGRSNARLEYLSSHLKEYTKERKWRVVDVWYHTMLNGLVPWMTDNSHFFASDVVDPVVDEIIGRAEICDS